jgi:hypothetical protein
MIKLSVIRGSARRKFSKDELFLLYSWTLSIVLFSFKTQRFGDWILSPSSGETYSVGPNRQS